MASPGEGLSLPQTSRERLPLSFGVGVRPANEPTSFVFRNVRQLKNSMLYSQAVFTPTPRSEESWTALATAGPCEPASRCSSRRNSRRCDSSSRMRSV
jgi:hypothetical protein